MMKQHRTPTTTAMIMPSRLFLRWMPSIRRPKPGTLAVKLARPPDEPVRELRCDVSAFLVSNA